MEFLRKLITQTGDYLKGLTLSQRLAIGCCVALIGMSLLWLVNWAGSPAMVPLLDQAMTADEITTIESRLKALGVKYAINGDALMVPAEERYRVYARLAESRALPRDTSMGFSELIKDNSSLWLNMTEQDRRWGVALQNTLAEVLRQFDGIEDARVFLDKRVKRTIGQAPVVPTASVFVRPRAGVKLSREQIFTMAEMVAGAVGGLDPTRVKVADMTTGRSYQMPDEQDTLAVDDLEDRQKKELYFTGKIKDLLANIPGLLVAVHAELDDESAQVVEEKYGKPVPLTDESESETMSRGRGAEEPGVNPNTSVAIAGGGTSESSEKNSSRTTFDGKVDRTVTTREKPRHTIEQLYAAINVPRSYLAAIYRKSNNDKEPTDDELDTFSKPEIAKIKNQVLRVLALIDPEQDKQVDVNWFHDEASIQMGTAMEATTSDGVMTLVKQHGTKAGLAGLALLSLFMMLMMVRRVSEGPVLPGEEPPPSRLIRVRGRDKGPHEIELMTADEPVGQAEESAPLLVGKEVDERTLQTQKVVEQVVGMIQDDPENSVGILKRWIDLEQA